MIMAQTSVLWTGSIVAAGVNSNFPKMPRFPLSAMPIKDFSATVEHLCDSPWKGPGNPSPLSHL
jgi:hypothetical protein